MYKVIKRDGTVADFDIQKVRRAIIKAFESVDRSYTDDVIDFIVLKVTADFEKKVTKENGILGSGFKYDTVNVEDVQDSVETVLVKSGYDQVAKSFILYRQQHARIRNSKKVLIDCKDTVEKYLGGSDWRVKENSTVSYSLGGLILSMSGAITANYWLSEIYDAEIAAAHRNCDIHIHDLSMLAPYCCGHDLKQLIKEGLNGVGGKIASAPAGHLSTLCNQMVNFLGCSQNEAAGAQAFSSFDTLLAPFVKKDNLTYKEVKQCIQSFVYGVNTPSRWGCVPENYLVMTTDGWKDIDTLKAGDTVYTWKDGKLSTCRNNATVIKEYDGDLFCFENAKFKYKQEVTDYHRVLYYPDKRHIVPAQIATAATLASDPMMSEYGLPARFLKDSDLPGIDLTDDEITLAAMLYTDGSIHRSQMSCPEVLYLKSMDRDKQINAQQIFDRLGFKVEPKINNTQYGSTVQIWKFYGDTARYMLKLIGQKDQIDQKFMKMNQRQARLFLDVWMMHDGVEEYSMAQVDNGNIQAALAFINVLAGYTSSYIGQYHQIQKCTCNYMKRTGASNLGFKVSKRHYKGRVFCPSSDDGTAIFMNDRGGVFISANCQAPFSNVTIDWTLHPDLKSQPAIVGGKEQDFTYGDCAKEQAMINKAFIEVMMEGDYNGRGHQYPIPTYSITKDFDWTPSENLKLLFEMAAKYGIPYFSNYVNSDMDPTEVKSMCCRLRLDLREVVKKNGGGLFGAQSKTGSIGVCTINFARLGYLATDEQDFYKRLDAIMDICARSLDIKRKVLTKFMDQGLYPYSKRYIGSFDTYFSTFGTIGMNEMCLNANWLRKNISYPECSKFTQDVLKHMVARIPYYQEMYNALFNVESVPGESTCYRLAKHDKEKYPDIITAGTDKVPYYSNSSNLPVGYTGNLYEALEHQDPIQILYTSGTVFHAYLGQRLPDWKSAATIIRKICENYRLPYITLSPTYSVCPEHGYIAGEHHTCPKCISNMENE